MFKTSLHVLTSKVNNILTAQTVPAATVPGPGQREREVLVHGGWWMVDSGGGGGGIRNIVWGSAHLGRSKF